MSETKRHQQAQKPPPEPRAGCCEQYGKWAWILGGRLFSRPLLVPPHNSAVAPSHKVHRKTQAPIYLPLLPITSALLWADPMPKPPSSKTAKSLPLSPLQAKVAMCGYPSRFTYQTVQSSLLQGHSTEPPRPSTHQP